MLLETGLVARTWGNVSCRLDDTRYLISPSGLAYTRTTEADIALCATGSDTWSGPRKPSSERGIHAAAYRQFPEVGFVIHTHQTYASALGLAGSDALARKNCTGRWRRRWRQAPTRCSWPTTAR